jgi:nucleoside-diphosphate-sugar epimerase
LVKRILVTGALGQIGTELTVALRERFGSAAVLATDIRPEPAGSIAGDGGYAVLDVTDPAAMARAVDDHRADTIFHMAAMLSAKGESDPQLCWRTNVTGVTNVLEVGRLRGLERVILPSTIAVFGPETPKEHTPQRTITRPRTMYGITKITGELLGSYYSRKYGLDVRGLRYPGIISSETEPGGGTTDYAVEMYYAAVRGTPYTCFVGEETTLPMMYMPDAVRALIELAEADRGVLTHHTSYNLAAFSFSAEELAAAIRRRVPSFRCTYAPDHRHAIAREWPRSIDDSEAREDWGWAHRYELESMTDDMIERLREKQHAGRL